jgi:hypothetical protein
MPIDFYLALLQLQLAVVGVVIAGVLALVQMLGTSKPRRDIRLLVNIKVLVAYAILLVGLLILLALGSWVGAFEKSAADLFGNGIVHFFASGQTGFFIVVLLLLSLAWFAELAFRSRTLLDSHDYIEHYVAATPAASVHDFLAFEFPDESSNPAGLPNVTRAPADPFQPIREYIKDSAFKYNDYGTADGLHQFGLLFDKALNHTRSRQEIDQAQYVRLARYISASYEEFFRIFVKTSSEQRQEDTVNILYNKGIELLQGGHDASHASLLPIVHGLENLAKLSDDDDEVISALGRIRQLCDAFLDSHKDHAWSHIAGPFDEICLSVTRVSENYYLQKNNSLKTVPIIGYETGTHRTVTAALVDFFAAYRNLGDRYTDAAPLYYFAAIESVIEVLFVRLGDLVDSQAQHVGFTMKYHELAHQLYEIYYSFGIDAIEHDKPELLTLALSNMRRVIKPAKNFNLEDERQDLCTMAISLATQAIAAFGDIKIKDDGRTISGYTLETVTKHATKAQITASLATLAGKSEIDHDSPPVKKLLKKLSI